MLRLELPLLRRLGLAVLSAAALLGLPGCGYNEFQTLDEQVTAAWAEVLSQYQRRSDLIPNIVATVKGEANFEQETLTKVIEARSKATAIQATPALVNAMDAMTMTADTAAPTVPPPLRLSGQEPLAIDAGSLFVNIGERTNVTGSKAFARASITLVSVSCSKLASPFTVATMFGIRSERRWYWFSTSDQEAFTSSSSRWKSL